ncbi:hypothetical protein [Geminocystis herdmanii]|uniref:hypothetical protein n=1 Tax=Geminocystis herdmanii TaxID=669359 RepID=UPI000344F398|nr:hypothetical protein [Geminocystis herdmanii]
MTTPHSNKSTLTNKDWYAIACKIRTQNQELKQETSELKTLIEEQKKQIKVQVIKNQDFQKKCQEYEKKIQQLETEINDSHIRIEEQNEQYQKQKIVMENLTKELKKNQQLAANLERDCSLLQDNYNQGQYHLKQKEKENKELHIRLQRQQRYNAQYKTALDHYLTNSDTPKDVNSLGIKSWSDNNISSQNNIINGTSETVNSMAEIPTFLNKIDEEIAQIDREVLQHDQNLEDNIKSHNDSLNNPILPPLKENISPNQEISKSEEKDNKKKPRNKSFLKLPKFGK